MEKYNMKWMQRLVMLGLVGLASMIANPAMADSQPVKATDIQAHMGWVRAVPPVSSNTSAYMMLHNYSQQDDQLVDILSPVAEVVEMHKTDMQDGVMKMSRMHSVTVPAKGHVMFEPAGNHIMLINLKEPLKVGSSVPLTLVFKHHGDINIQLDVTHPPESTKPMQHNHSMHH